LNKLIDELPHDRGVDAAPLAAHLAGRPLSDVTYVVREAARLAARAGKAAMDQATLLAALAASPARGSDGGGRRKIGFV
jgi:hypothetical protein